MRAALNKGCPGQGLRRWRGQSWPRAVPYKGAACSCAMAELGADFPAQGPSWRRAGALARAVLDKGIPAQGLRPPPAQPCGMAVLGKDCPEQGLTCPPGPPGQSCAYGVLDNGGFWTSAALHRAALYKGSPEQGLPRRATHLVRACCPAVV